MDDNATPLDLRFREKRLPATAVDVALYDQITRVLTWSINYRTTVVKSLLVLARLELFVRLGVFHTVFSTKEVKPISFSPKSLYQILNYQFFNICRVLYPIVLKPHLP